jgi:hypothetical protein
MIGLRAVVSRRGWAVIVVATVATVGTLAGLISCRQIVGISDSAPQKLTTYACGLPFGKTTCASCMNAHCCAESTACAGDVACAPFFQCLGGCADADWTCRAQCWTDHQPAETESFAPLNACEVSSCASECGFTCGNGPLFAPPDAATSCLQCLNAGGSCEAEHDCSASVSCATGEQCFGGCFETTDCADRCTPSTDAGAALYSAAGSLLFQCGAKCGIGVNWSCIGHVAPRLISSNGSTFVVIALDPNSYSPVAGIDVRACYPGDTSCIAYSGTGLTDPTTGSATLQIAPALSGHGLEADAYLQLTSGGTAPVFYYWGFDVSAPRETFDVGVASLAFWQGAFGTWDYNSRGIVFFYVSDCTPFTNQSLGVEVALSPTDSLVSEYYAQGSTGNFDAMATDVVTQIGLPAGGFVNVRPGTVTLTATARAIGKAYSTATVLVSAGTITYAYLRPAH